MGRQWYCIDRLFVYLHAVCLSPQTRSHKQKNCRFMLILAPTEILIVNCGRISVIVHNLIHRERGREVFFYCVSQQLCFALQPFSLCLSPGAILAILWNAVAGIHLFETIALIVVFMLTNLLSN